MNAHSNLTSKRQSIAAQCRDKRWRLLQLFAEAEILMARRVPAPVPTTFGAKLRALPKSMAVADEWKSLAVDRNLLAHALVDIVETKREWVAQWRVADTQAGGTNASIMNENELKAWEKRVSATLDDFIKALSKS
jgi:hypothetical protein